MIKDVNLLQRFNITRNNIEFLIESVVYIVLLLLLIYIVCKMDIAKFLRISKERDLSDQSDSGKQKKM